jgi:hypothetical protein
VTAAAAGAAVTAGGKPGQPNTPAAAGSSGRVGAADGLSVGVPSNGQEGPRAVSPGGPVDWYWLLNKSLSLSHHASAGC